MIAYLGIAQDRARILGATSPGATAPGMTTPCLMWTGRKDGRHVRATTSLRGVKMAPGRAALLLSGIEAPKHLMVCHACDEPGCVSPDHLYLGTAAHNSRDRDSKGRGVGGDPRDAEHIRRWICRMISAHGHVAGEWPEALRPGPPMTDAEWAEVTAYADRVGVSPVEAMRRLIRAGLDSPIG